jgi:glycoside/pentoside/hexuronide:cation symporter, GPH family
MSSAADPAPRSELSTGTRVAYGASAFAENLAINSIVQLANPVFNLVLGVSPMLIGAALALPRLWDAFADPWVGSWSDNFRSRWGRRRPFIAVGAILTGACAAAVWFFPTGRSPAFYFGWLLVGAFIMATAYTVFVVPYGALGLELTTGYHERTRLMAVKSALHKSSGIVNQWLLHIVQLSVFAGVLAGTRFCGVVIGITVACLGLWTVLRVKERRDFQGVPPARMPLWHGWRETMRQPDFRRIVIAQVCIYASVLLVDTVGFYLNVFYVNHGNLKYAGLLKGASGTAFQAGGLCFIPLIAWLSRRYGKQRAFLLCTASIVLAGVAKWFCYVPDAGWWLVLPSFLLAPGLVAVMVMVPSMTADICDLDEVHTGARREGMYNAVAGWLLKLAMSGAAFGAGALLALCGWRTELAARQTPGTFLAMRIAFALGTIILAVTAALALRRYHVNEESVLAAREQMRRATTPILPASEPIPDL